MSIKNVRKYTDSMVELLNDSAKEIKQNAPVFKKIIHEKAQKKAMMVYEKVQHATSQGLDKISETGSHCARTINEKAPEYKNLIKNKALKATEKSKEIGKSGLELTKTIATECFEKSRANPLTSKIVQYKAKQHVDELTEPLLMCDCRKLVPLINASDSCPDCERKYKPGVYTRAKKGFIKLIAGASFLGGGVVGMSADEVLDRTLPVGEVYNLVSICANASDSPRSEKRQLILLNKCVDKIDSWINYGYSYEQIKERLRE